MLHVACCTWWDLYWRRIWRASIVHINHKPQISVCTCPGRVCGLPAQLQLDCLPACWTCVSGLRLDWQTLQEVPHGWGSNGLSYRRTVEIIHSKYDRLALQQAINLVGWDSTRSILVSSVDCQITARVGAATTSMAPKCAETIKITFLGKRNPWHGCQKSRQCPGPTDRQEHKQCQTAAAAAAATAGIHAHNVREVARGGSCTKTV